jgi:urocanate reductase
MGKKHMDSTISRRKFIRNGAALGVGATALGGLGSTAAASAPQVPAQWDHAADVVIAGAGASGIAAAIMARDSGATVIALDENYDLGGHAMVSGGRIPLGGGTSLQRRYGISDSADQVFLDHTNQDQPEFRYCDRELVRVWADENAPTFEFLIENGVEFREMPPSVTNRGSVPRLAIAEIYSANMEETISASPGSGLMRPLGNSALAKGVEFLFEHRLTGIVRESPSSGRVLGVTATSEGRDVNIQARRGVIVATGGHTSNVELRRIFDPRLTEEYQVAGEPWTRQSGDGERFAMAIGASLWATANQNREAGIGPVTKTRHIGCRYGYQNMKWTPESPVFPRARAGGLTVRSYQDMIMVNQVGRRFWNEMDNGYGFRNAALGPNGNLGRGPKPNGGGPIWAIFDAEAVVRERWDPTPPNVDPDGYFFSADTIAELAERIVNPYQLEPVPADVLVETVAAYNSYVESGADPDFEKPTPMYKIETPPYYAAWATPILHDSLTGLRINTRCQVVDLGGEVIPGLYAAGESAGGFALHGLPRVLVFGRIAGREAARS